MQHIADMRKQGIVPARNINIDVRYNRWWYLNYTFCFRLNPKECDDYTYNTKRNWKSTLLMDIMIMLRVFLKESQPHHDKPLMILRCCDAVLRVLPLHHLVSCIPHVPSHMHINSCRPSIRPFHMQSPSGPCINICCSFRTASTDADGVYNMNARQHLYIYEMWMAEK